MNSHKNGGIEGLLMLLGYSFRTYWITNEDKITNVYRNKNVLALIITVCFLIGIAMTASGISNLQGTRFRYDITPVSSKQARHNYLLLTVVGFLYMIAAIFGYFGVCERKNIFAKAYMMICIPFGLGLLLLYFIWVLLDHILIPDFELTENGIEKLVISPYDIIVSRYFMSFMLLSAVLQMVCGVLIFLVLYKYRRIRGYISIDPDEPDFDVLLDALRERRPLVTA